MQMHICIQENFTLGKFPSDYWSLDVQLLFLMTFVHSISFRVNLSGIFLFDFTLKSLRKINVE